MNEPLVERPPIEEELDTVTSPPPALQRGLEREPLCGGRFEILWMSGPMRGQTTTTYCAEPFCIQTGKCTGAKFVPHSTQKEPDGAMRRLNPAEVVPAVRESARKATGKDDPRSDREIRAFVALVYSRMRNALRGRW